MSIRWFTGEYEPGVPNRTIFPGMLCFSRAARRPRETATPNIKCNSVRLNFSLINARVTSYADQIVTTSMSDIWKSIHLYSTRSYEEHDTVIRYTHLRVYTDDSSSLTVFKGRFPCSFKVKMFRNLPSVFSHKGSIGVMSIASRSSEKGQMVKVKVTYCSWN
jgi:hypothetical protein